METVIENNERTSSSEDMYYYWFSYDGTKEIIPMNPYDHLESEHIRRYEKIHFPSNNKECLCAHAFLHPMKLRKGWIYLRMFIQSNEGNSNKNWNRNRLMGLHLSEYIHDLDNYEITESNIK